MNYITTLEAAKLLNISRQHFLKKCRAGDFELYPCACMRSHLVDEEKVRSAVYKKHTKSGFDKFHQKRKQEI